MCAPRLDPTLYARLENAVRRRSATLSGFGWAFEAQHDGLNVIAAGGTSSINITCGPETFRKVLQKMHDN